MEITIKGNPKEIADLVPSIQNRQLEIESPLNLVSNSIRLSFQNFQKGKATDERRH